MGTVANLAVRISANAQEFEKGVSDIDNRLGGLSGTIGKVGASLLAAFSLSAIDSAIGRIGDWGGKIVDFSNRLGLSIETVQRFKFAAEQGGSSIETIGRAMELASRKIASGDEGFIEALRMMGVSFAQIKNQAPEQQFLTLARALNDVEDPARRDALAFELFGRSGQELQQILPTLIADLSRAPVATDAAAQSADRLGDSWDRLKDSIAAVGGSAIMDSISMKLEGVANEAQQIRDLFGDSNLAGAFAAASNNAKGLNDVGLKPLTMTMAEASRIEREIEANIKKTNQARQEAIRWQEQQNAQYRQFLNFVGEREIEDEKRFMEERQQQIVANFMEEGAQIDALTDRYMASYDEREAAEAAHRQMMNDIGVAQMEAEAAQIQQRSTVWTEFWGSITEGTSYAFAEMLTGATSFHDGFISIWHSIRSAITNIVADLLENVIGGLFRGMANMLGGGSFGGGFGNILGGLGGIFGGGGGGAASTAASVGGAAATGGGFMSGLGGLLTNPWTAVAGGVAALVGSIWKGGLFRGGEEALHVNPARDSFLSQFGDVGNKDVGGAGWNLAAKLTEMGFGHGGGQLFADLQRADSMEEYEAALRAVQEALASGSQTAVADSVALETASVTSTAAVDSLAASISNLAAVAQATSAAILGGMASPAGDVATLWDSSGINAGDVVEVPGFSSGSGGFRNFGRGTLAMLHGHEAVVTPDDMAGSGASINVYLSGTLIGNSREFEDAVGRAFNRRLERGGTVHGKNRKMVSQMVSP